MLRSCTYRGSVSFTPGSRWPADCINRLLSATSRRLRDLAQTAAVDPWLPFAARADVDPPSPKRPWRLPHSARAYLVALHAYRRFNTKFSLPLRRETVVNRGLLDQIWNFVPS